jgi:ubiquitin C-terminal hydrolase
LWTDGYNALFRLEYEETWYCKGCGTLILSDPVNHFVNTKTHTEPELGFLAVRIRRKKEETVRRAIVRKMADERRMTRHACPAGKCGSSATVMRRYRIEAAPEYLRVALGLVRYHSGGSSKIMHPVKVERTLDLTDLQRDPSTPLHYRLICVTSHQGPSFEAGHWITAVQGPSQKYYAINDDTVRKETGNYMTMNPHDGSEAIILMYKRIRPSQ